MRVRYLNRLLEEHLVPHLDGFSVHEGMLIATPVGDLLRGFCFDRSQLDRTSFYVNVFVQTLCVPLEHVVLTVGHRLGGASNYWDLAEGEPDQVMSTVLAYVRHEGLRWLDTLATPLDLADRLPSLVRLDDDPQRLEVLAYAFLLGGEVGECRRVIAEALSIDDVVDWELESQERLMHVRDRLDAGGFDEARKVLDAWRAYTAEQLRLPRSFVT